MATAHVTISNLGNAHTTNISIPTETPVSSTVNVILTVTVFWYRTISLSTACAAETSTRAAMAVAATALLTIGHSGLTSTATGLGRTVTEITHTVPVALALAIIWYCTSTERATLVTQTPGGLTLDVSVTSATYRKFDSTGPRTSASCSTVTWSGGTVTVGVTFSARLDPGALLTRVTKTVARVALIIVTVTKASYGDLGSAASVAVVLATTAAPPWLAVGVPLTVLPVWDDPLVPWLAAEAAQGVPAETYVPVPVVSLVRGNAWDTFTISNPTQATSMTVPQTCNTRNAKNKIKVRRQTRKKPIRTYSFRMDVHLVYQLNMETYMKTNNVFFDVYIRHWVMMVSIQGYSSGWTVLCWRIRTSILTFLIITTTFLAT